MNINTKSNTGTIKRILYVTPWDIIGGASNSLYYLMLDMKRRHKDIEPVMLNMNHGGEMTRQCALNGIEYFTAKGDIWRVKGRGLTRRLIQHTKNIIKNILYHRKISDFIKHSHFDLVHSNTSSPLLGHEIAKRLGIPHVWHLRDYGIDDFNLHYIFPDEYVRRVFAESEAIITISRSVNEYYVNEMKLCQADKTRIIYNGVMIPETYSKKYLNEGCVNFCMTGKIVTGKNQIMAVYACEKLLMKTNKFMLHIIGQASDTRYADRIRHMIKSAGLDEHVKLWGFRTDVNDILRDMDIGLMLSKREGFGRVTAEYMMHYMPVIGVDTGATPEIVLDGETGYICRPDDADMLAELMHKFIVNPGLIREMGTKGRERAVKNFSLERNTDGIYKLYQEILTH